MQTFYLVEVDNFARNLLLYVVVIADGDGLARLDRAALYPADADTADVIVIVDRRYEDLCCALFVHFHRLNVAYNSFEKGRKVFALFVQVERCRAVSARAPHYGRHQLVVGSVELQ